jgi:hypothetical protein
MRWFGRKAGRGSARPALARGFGTAFATGEWPRSYEAQVTVVQIGASAISRPAQIRIIF